MRLLEALTVTGEVDWPGNLTVRCSTKYRTLTTLVEASKTMTSVCRLKKEREMLEIRLMRPDCSVLLVDGSRNCLSSLVVASEEELVRESISSSKSPIRAGIYILRSRKSDLNMTLAFKIRLKKLMTALIRGDEAYKRSTLFRTINAQT